MEAPTSHTSENTTENQHSRSKRRKQPGNSPAPRIAAIQNRFSEQPILAAQIQQLITETTNAREDYDLKIRQGIPDPTKPQKTFPQPSEEQIPLFYDDEKTERRPPDETKEKVVMIVSSTNITSLDNHKWDLANMDGTRCIQEHQLPHNRERALERFFKQESAILHIDKSFSQGANFSAGTGFIHDNDIIARQIIPTTGPLIKPHKNGRISICTVVASTTLPFFIYNVYGFVHNSDDPLASIRTEALMEAVFDDWVGRGCPPALITGDLNADAMKIPSVARLINLKAWLDVGSRASLYGKPDNQPTCLAPNSRTKTRREYILASPIMVPSIKDLNVQDNGTFHVHAAVSITIALESELYTAISFRQAPPIVQPPISVDMNRKEKVQSIKDFQTQEAIRTHQTFVDHHHAEDTNALWHQIWKVFESGLLTASDCIDQNVNCGGGNLRYDYVIKHPRLATHQHNPNDSVIKDDDQRTKDLKQALTDISLMKVATRKIYNQCNFVTRNLRITTDKLRPWLPLAVKKLFNDNPDMFQMRDLHEYDNGNISGDHFAKTLEFATRRIKKDADNEKAKETRAAAAVATNYYRNTQTGTPAAYRNIRAPPAPTLSLLDSARFPNGAVTPTQFDYEYDLAWFHAVNCPPHTERPYARHFIEKYQAYFDKQPTINLPPITGRQLSQAATHSSAFVGGLDSLHPKEMLFVSSTLWEWVAIILNMVEKGAPWPTPALLAKAAFLRKLGTTGKSMNDYRILTLTSVIYPMWGKVRCKQLGPLYKHWGDDGLVTAGPGLGASDAHCNLAIRFEHARVFHTGFAGGATDLSQCFDRILREQVYPIAIQSGMPIHIILAYASHAENLTYVNCYPTGHGRLRRRSASIAQGCPFSMRVLAICLQPWMKVCAANNVIPRILADDLMVFATGPDAAILAAKALLLTHEYILDIRGKVKTEKTWAYASLSNGRDILHHIRFPGSDGPMIIVQNHRDLGRHLDSSNRGTGSTLTHRLNTATNELNTITTKFGGAAQRATIVRGKFHARGLYSADTTPVNQYALDRLCTATTRFILGTNRTPAIRNLRSVSLTLIAYQPPSGATNDPVHIVCKGSHQSIAPRLAQTNTSSTSHRRARD